jgi:hypothetical protein
MTVFNCVWIISHFSVDIIYYITVALIIKKTLYLNCIIYFLFIISHYYQKLVFSEYVNIQIIYNDYSFVL